MKEKSKGQIQSEKHRDDLRTVVILVTTIDFCFARHPGQGPGRAILLEFEKNAVQDEIVRSIRLLLLLVVTQGFLVAQDVLIKDARVFDGQRVIPRASVLVRDGKIEKIGTHIRVPRNVHIVDGRGKTLIPGLIDAHTHIRSRRDLEQSAVFGVTTDISMLTEKALCVGQHCSRLIVP